MSDYIIIALLTLAVYYPLTLGGLAVMMFFAWRRRRSPYWRLGLALLALLFVLWRMTGTATASGAMTGYSTLIIQLTPNLSVSIPKPLAQKVAW
jgi:hypothetical protein